MEQSEQDVLMFHERNHEVEDDLSKVLKTNKNQVRFLLNIRFTWYSKNSE
jgi:hypothetical protein